MKTSLIISTLLISALSWAGIDRGNPGGDPLMFEFEVARTQAVNRIRNIKPCSFSADVPTPVKDWILNNELAIADDVASSQHVWVTDSQTTCAHTQLQSRSDIVLSFVNCRPGIKETNDAGKILVHESTHHFGISDELFATQVGEAVYSAGTRSSCSVPPAADPFDSASCPGTHLNPTQLKQMIGLPNTNQTAVGTFKASARVRTCYGPDFCSDWTVDNQLFYTPGTYGHSTVSDFGLTDVRLFKNDPEIYLIGDADRTNSLAYRFASKIVDEDHMEFRHTHESMLNGLWLGTNKIESEISTGWVTNSCYRQVIKNETPMKDGLSNNIIKQFEMVFLSRFSSN